MKVNEELMEYLYGNKFDSGKIFDFPSLGYDGSRMDCVLNKILGDKNAKVVHLGACDHLDLIAEKRKENRWCHDLLMQHSDCVLGIDINQEAVEYCESQGVDNIICANMLTEQPYIIEKMGGLGLSICRGSIRAYR